MGYDVDDRRRSGLWFQFPLSEEAANLIWNLSQLPKETDVEKAERELSEHNAKNSQK